MNNVLTSTPKFISYPEYLVGVISDVISPFLSTRATAFPKPGAFASAGVPVSSAQRRAP